MTDEQRRWAKDQIARFGATRNEAIQVIRDPLSGCIALGAASKRYEASVAAIHELCSRLEAVKGSP